MDLKDEKEEIQNNRKEHDLNARFLESSNEDNVSPSKNKCFQFYGVFFCLLSAFLLAASNILVRKAIFFNGSDQTLIRYLIQLITMIPVACYTKNSLLGIKQSRKNLIFRGIFGFLSILLVNFSLKIIAPSDAKTIFNLNIILVSIIGRIYFKDKLTVFHLISLLMAMVGVFLIVQPSFLFQKEMNFNKSMISNTTSVDSSSTSEKEVLKWNRTIGISISLLAAIVQSIFITFIKKLTNQNVHYSVSLLFGSYFGVPLSFLLTSTIYLTGNSEKDRILRSNTSEILFQVLYSISSAIVGLSSQLFLNISLEYESSSIISIVRSTELVFVFILQYIFLDIESNLFSSIGTLLIFTGIMMILVHKILEEKASKMDMMNKNVLLKFLIKSY